MGGAVISTMDFQNRRSQVPHEDTATFRQRLKKVGNFLRAVPGTEADNASCVYRFSEVSDDVYDDMKEVYWGENYLQTLRKVCRARADHVMCASRPVDRVAREEVTDPATGKVRRVDITYLKPTVTYTFREVWERIDAFGRGLANLGVPAKSNVAIYQETCLEWFITVNAIWSQGMTAATVYANLGESALAYALHETEVTAVICGSNIARNIVKLMHDGVVPSAPVIYIGASLPASFNAHGVKLYSFEEVVKSGMQLMRKGLCAGTPSRNNDDLALIMYTSGTTGTPKGVMHSHGSLIAGMTCIMSRVKDIIGEPREGDSYCAYLPMAHILEFTVTSIFIMRGALVGFGSPRTLTDATARPHGDFTEFKPSFVIGVPRVFDTLKKAILSKLPEPGTLKRRIFDHAYESRLKALKEGYETPYWNEKVFAATRALVGGRMRGCLSGGGPISASTQEFVSVTLGPCVAGYGMTEGICVGAIQMIGDWETGTIGPIEPGEEIKLVDTEHYKHTDKPEPRGELVHRGHFLFRGYYKQPELTKQSFDKDGWFRTGDVASITSDGKLRIIGRVKAIAKNSLGEYIAMEALEAIYSSNPLLQPNGVCVLVHPNRNYICAVALTDEAKAMAFAKKEGIEGEWPAILEKPEFQAAAARSLVQTAVDANRRPFECVRHVRVLNDEWSPENEVLTAAQKLKRNAIDARYANTIKELFAEE